MRSCNLQALASTVVPHYLKQLKMTMSIISNVGDLCRANIPYDLGEKHSAVSSEVFSVQARLQ